MEDIKHIELSMNDQIKERLELADYFKKELINNVGLPQSVDKMIIDIMLDGETGKHTPLSQGRR